MSGAIFIGRFRELGITALGATAGFVGSRGIERTEWVEAHAARGLREYERHSK